MSALIRTTDGANVLTAGVLGTLRTAYGTSCSWMAGVTGTLIRVIAVRGACNSTRARARLCLRVRLPTGTEPLSSWAASRFSSHGEYDTRVRYRAGAAPRIWAAGLWPCARNPNSLAPSARPRDRTHRPQGASDRCIACTHAVCTGSLWAALGCVRRASRRAAAIGRRRAAVNREQRGDLGSSKSAIMPRRRRCETALRRVLLLLPLRVFTETPYAKTPYEQWEEDTYYPHSRGGPYQACLKAHLVPKTGTYSRLRRAAKNRKILHDHLSQKSTSRRRSGRNALDRCTSGGTACFDACEETHCSYHGSCPEHPPDVEFPYDDPPPRSRRTPRSRTPTSRRNPSRTSRTSGATSRKNSGVVIDYALSTSSCAVGTGRSENHPHLRPLRLRLRRRRAVGFSPCLVVRVDARQRLVGAHVGVERT